MAADNVKEPARYNTAIEELRQIEYPSITDAVYLDHAGTTLPSRTLLESFSKEITTTLYGNPHSASWPSQLSTSRIEDVRLELLSFFRADPSQFDLVFVANATAGIKLLVDALRSMPNGFGLIHHEACHTSVVGAREEALWTRCVNDDDTRSWLAAPGGGQDADTETSATLFAYPAQSHFDGKRYPPTWSDEARRASSARTYTLLDASSFCATSQLDLSRSDSSPDFVVLSLYKIFGFPDLGILLVRKPAQEVFLHRKYFGGGTVDMVVCGDQQWYAPKSQSLHERLEDGTLPFHNIIAAGIALETHASMFGTMSCISSHTSRLAAHLRKGLSQLRHKNGLAACVQYGTNHKDDSVGVGPIVTFNLRDSAGTWVSLSEFEKLANLKKIYVRTGGMCSPGGIASALDLKPWEMRRNFSAGFRCGAEDDIVAGKPTGAIRASLGPMSTMSDVTRFLDFLTEFYVDQLSQPDADVQEAAFAGALAGHPLRVKSVIIFPIKSCGGYSLPEGTEWEIKPEGLAWDREWCLVHRGSGQALSQKRYPMMAILKPKLDFDAGVLRVSCRGTDGRETMTSVPLTEDPSLFDSTQSEHTARVCGEPVSMMRYASNKINDFFSEALGVPCVLCRFPAGGRGTASRASKARMQSHQRRRVARLPGTFPGVPSPPDSDSELQQPGNILLSNESPILMITTSSVAELNQRITDSGGSAVPDSTFRANIVLEPSGKGTDLSAYAEDQWQTIGIGQERFELLGACRRCQMVCVDQERGQRGQEPLNTLAKTRRFDGKVYFGVHMRHAPSKQVIRKPLPLIKVGDLVGIDSQR